jgi:hypothetical protein
MARLGLVTTKPGVAMRKAGRTCACFHERGTYVPCTLFPWLPLPLPLPPTIKPIINKGWEKGCFRRMILQATLPPPPPALPPLPAGKKRLTC